MFVMQLLATLIKENKDISGRYIYVTGSEKTWLPHTQQQDALFTIKR